MVYQIGQFLATLYTLYACWPKQIIILFLTDVSVNQTKRKRSSYDLRCRGPERPKLPALQMYQTVINKNSDGGETFWTCCTSCKFKFKYHKIFVNNVLKCRTCSKNFTAYELDAESTPPESDVQSVKQMVFFTKTKKSAGMNSSQEGRYCCSVDLYFIDKIIFVVTSP